MFQTGSFTGLALQKSSTALQNHRTPTVLTSSTVMANPMTMLNKEVENNEVENMRTLKLVGEMGGQSKAVTENLQPSMLSLAEKPGLGSNLYLQNIRKT